MKILVTGGAGFIGSSVTELLAEHGHQVLVFDNLSSSAIEPSLLKSEFRSGSVTRLDDVLAAGAGCDILIHLAARRSVPYSWENAIDTNETNTGGTLAVLEAGRRLNVNRVILTSSSSVYGRGVSVDGAHLLSPYAVSKYGGELYGKVYAENLDMDVVTLRPFNVYGPRQQADSPYAAVIPRFLATARTGQRPVIHGTGGQSRSFCYVTDVARAYLAACQADERRGGFRVCDVGGQEQTTIRALATKIYALIGVEFNPVFESRRPGDIDSSSPDLPSTLALIGWSPQVGLNDGLEALRDALVSDQGA